MRARAHEPHTVPERPPLRLTPGDRVLAGPQSEEWPAFVFVTTPQGEGWVPARHLTAQFGPAVIAVEYDTTELPLAIGQLVTVVERDELSGWWWCRDSLGGEGWVPVAALTPLG